MKNFYFLFLKIIALIKVSIFEKKMVLLKIKDVLFDNLICFSKNKVYKVSLNNKSTLSNEIANYKKVSELGFKNNVFPKFGSSKNNKILALEKLYPINKEEYFLAFNHIFNSFSSNNSYTIFSLSEFEMVKRGYEIFKKYLPNDDFLIIQTFINKISSKKYTTGYCHGDLHSRNILKDLNGNYKVIDLDCFRVNGIRDLDVIYYIIELLWLENQKHWKDNLLTLTKGKLHFDDYLQFLEGDFDEIIIIYFLDRFGQESNYEEYNLNSVLHMYTILVQLFKIYNDRIY